MRSARHGSAKNVVLTGGLSLLLAVQIGFVIFRSRQASSAAIVSPERIEQLELLDRRGAPTTPLALTSGSSSVALLAFNDQCAWCDSIAEIWTKELARLPRGLNVVLISAGDPGAAVDYSVRHRWNARLVHVDTSGGGAVERYVTARTPWIYVVDPSGRLVKSQHGALLGEVLAEYRE